MAYRWPSDNDPYAIFHLSLSRTPSFENYYTSIEALAPNLNQPEWKESNNGFYLSSVNFGIPRLTYFAADTLAATKFIDEICKKLLSNPVMENYEFEIEEIN